MNRPATGIPLGSAALVPRTTAGLRVRLAVASAIAVSLVVGSGAFYAYLRERDHLLESMNEAAATQGRLTLTGLKFAMLENNRSLLHDLVDQYARSAEVDRVFVADATGHVAIASAAGWRGRSISLPDGVCPTCVVPAGSELHTSEETVEGRRVLRSVTVISNEPRCGRCHPQVQRTLGALGVDFSMAPVDRASRAMIASMALWGFAVAALVLVAVGTVVHVGALAPLRRLGEAARSVLPQKEPPAKNPLRRDEIVELATALHDTHEHIDRQRRFLVDLIDQVEDGVAVLDKSLTVIAANQSYLRHVGCGRDQVGRLACKDTALCGQAESYGDCPARAAFRTRALQKRIAKHDQSFIEVFASPIVGAGGQVEQVVEVWRDVTERVALQANLARSEQLAAVGTLASAFSHEISTPLGTVSNAIQGTLRLVSDRERLEADEIGALRQRLETASHEIFRCRDITRSLLDLGRQRRTVRDRVQIVSVVQRMLGAVRPTADQQAVAVVSRCPSELPLVLGHADQLEQVFLNLFMNAIEEMQGGGTLEIEAGLAASGIEVIVADSGPGVAAADRERIFDPFFTRKAGGTGLGLYVSRQLIEAHGGRLELMPSARGARFRVYLPLFGGAA